MNLRRPLSPLKIPSGEYKREDINRIVNAYNELVHNVYNPGDIVASSFQLISASGSGFGKPVGTFYVDDNGNVKIVQNGDLFAPSFDIRIRIGTVTLGS